MLDEGVERPGYIGTTIAKVDSFTTAYVVRFKLPYLCTLYKTRCF
jgi:hypothetical protein